MDHPERECLLEELATQRARLTMQPAVGEEGGKGCTMDGVHGEEQGAMEDKVRYKGIPGLDGSL